MAQISQRRIGTFNAEFNSSTYAVLPGLDIDILTGSGWLEIVFQAVLKGNDTTPGRAFTHLFIDDVEQAIDADGGAVADVGAAEYVTIRHALLIRAGAGQHNFRVNGYATIAGIVFYGYAGSLTVRELGF